MIKRATNKFVYAVVGIAVLGAVAFLFLNGGAPKGNVRDCSSDTARPCFERETANNSQTAAAGTVKNTVQKEKLDKENGDKEFSECIKKGSNRRGKEREQTKVCNAEVITYCEGTWANDDKENAKNENKRIKKYEGKCEPPPAIVTQKPPLRASYEIIPLNLPSPIPMRISDTQNGKYTEVFRYKITADPKNDANIYVFASVPYARSLGDIPMDCSNIFFPDSVFLTDASPILTLGNQSVFGMFPGNVGSTAWGLCVSFSGWWFPLTPGEQKTISLEMAAKPTAQVGLQFKLSSAATVTSFDPITSPPEDRGVIILDSAGVESLGGTGASTNYIIIAP